jgi:hypothetical protein
MVEVFDARSISFVAVTQQFNTTTSMGRLTRVELDQEGMWLSLRLPSWNAASGPADGSGQLSIKRRISMQLKRRGVELRLVINGRASASRKTDQSLLKAVVRAHCWFEDLVLGQSMVEIARHDRVGKQYVSRLIRLAFLAPEVVELIVAGRQPPELSAHALQTGRFNIPVEWAAQKRTLGFAQPA